MPRPITAVIHRQSLQHNLNVARTKMPNSQVYAVVKANAYGHGIERVYQAFKSADGFALLWAGKVLSYCLKASFPSKICLTVMS